MKILDCTIRDGGYYTQWDFNRQTTNIYFESMDKLPIDYLEVGYRSKPMDTYFGEYFYCPQYVLNNIRKHTSKPLAIILNEKDVMAADAKLLLEPVKEYIKMVRLAIDPQNFKRSLGLAGEVKRMGFEVCMNVMYMSTWEKQKDFLELLKESEGVGDYLYMVDSYGGVYPDDVKKTFDTIRSKTSIKIGFHGHNNLELGLINTLTAIQCGVDIVDATITGMGRGAGNLKTELLLTALNKNTNLQLDFNELSKAVDEFTRLQESYRWGTSLPYMVSGAYSLPQKDVMEWVTLRYYSLNSIIRALAIKAKGGKDTQKLPVFDFSKENKFDSAIIIGGGNTPVDHSIAIRRFLEARPHTAVIHASSKNAMSFYEIPNNQFFCLVGNEGHRLEKIFSHKSNVKGKCILPPSPRKMGTYVPKILENQAFELECVDFTAKLQDTHTALALQTAKMLGVKTLFVVGYDGYSGKSVTEKEQNLFLENEQLFSMIKSDTFPEIISLTATKYSSLTQQSVYSYL